MPSAVTRRSTEVSPDYLTSDEFVHFIVCVGLPLTPSRRRVTRTLARAPARRSSASATGQSKSSPAVAPPRRPADPRSSPRDPLATALAFPFFSCQIL